MTLTKYNSKAKSQIIKNKSIPHIYSNQIDKNIKR